MVKILISLKTLENKSIFIFSAILFKIILEYTYVNFVNFIYAYLGFDLDVSFIKYLESWIIYLLFLSFTPHILKKTSDFVINILFFSYLSPLLVFYSLTNATREYLYIVLLGILIIFLFRQGKKIKVSNIKNGHIYAYILCILGVLSVCLWLVFSGGLNFFNLNLARVYDFRSDVGSAINLGLMGYLNIWAFKVFGPFLLIIFLSSRMYFFASLIFLLHFFWFGVSSNKAVIFYPFIILFVFIWFKNNKGLSLIPISFILIIFFSYLFYIIFDNNLFGSLFIRRLFFVPSFLTYTYYDFFSNEQYIFWSNSVTSAFIDYPYNLSPPKLIGEYLGTQSNANNSFLSTGFMHAGILGIVFYAIIFALVLRLYDSFIYNQKFVWISVAVIIVPVRSLITGTDLPTALLTHGILLSLLLLALYRYKFK